MGQYDKQRQRYVNQAIQREKQARNDKLEKIAGTLPNVKSNENQGTRTPYSTTQTSYHSLRIVTQTTPRSGITRGQNQPPISTPVPKLGTSIINKPSLLISNKKTDPDETSSEESTKEESSESDDKSSDSDTKRAPVKATNTNKRR